MSHFDKHFSLITGFRFLLKYKFNLNTSLSLINNASIFNINIVRFGVIFFEFNAENLKREIYLIKMLGIITP